MTYFSLRKDDPEPEPEEDVDEPAVEEADEEPPAGKSAGPLRTGLTGPSAWLAARFGIGTAFGVHVVAVWACFFYGGWVIVGVVGGWGLAVLLFIPREQLERAAAVIERRDKGRHTLPATPPVAGPAGGGREPVLRLLFDLIGDAHGVHLRTVLAHLQEHGQWEGKTVADLRLHLEALGIPVQPKVKVAGTPTRGVLRTDLEALPAFEETAPSPGPSPVV
jgi:hypothetical protein